MSIPLATHTVTVKGRRPQPAIDPDAEGYDGPPAAETVLAVDVRACISQPASASGNGGGAAADEVVTYALRLDPIAEGLNRFDTVTDQATGVVYMVQTTSVSPTTAFGLEHIIATLTLTRGLGGLL